MVAYNLSSKLIQFYHQRKQMIIVTAIICVCLFGYIKPQKFYDLWLTHDQQGYLLFKLSNYQQAANHFDNTNWQAYSLYGAEEFEKASILYNQMEGVQSKLNRANALAHGRRYIKARNIYNEILSIDPENEAALHNQQIVQAIIDDVNRLSESQQAEDGDSVKELGDEPQTGDGAEKKVTQKQLVEQFDAKQLLLDPALNEMWLRQVQKDPALFLANKFHLQNEKKSELDKKSVTDKETQERQND